MSEKNHNTKFWSAGTKISTFTLDGTAAVHSWMLLLSCKQRCAMHTYSTLYAGDCANVRVRCVQLFEREQTMRSFTMATASGWPTVGYRIPLACKITSTRFAASQFFGHNTQRMLIRLIYSPLQHSEFEVLYSLYSAVIYVYQPAKPKWIETWPNTYPYASRLSTTSSFLISYACRMKQIVLLRTIGTLDRL